MKRFVFSFLKELLGLVEILLVLRIVLRYFGANPYALAVKLLYQITGFLIYPFKGIFPDAYFSGFGLIDLSALSAGFGYLILVLVVLKFLRLFVEK